MSNFTAPHPSLYYLAFLKQTGSIIFLDDLQLPGIHKVVSFFEKNLEWKIEAEGSISKDHHWAALRTRFEVLERNFDAFTDFLNRQRKW